MKRRQTGSAMSGASMSSFLKNQGYPKIPLYNRGTRIDVNGSAAGAEELCSDFF